MHIWVIIVLQMADAKPEAVEIIAPMDGQLEQGPLLEQLVENYLGHFLEKLQKNIEKVQTNAGKRGGRSAPLCCWGICCTFSIFLAIFQKMAQVVFHTC